MKKNTLLALLAAVAAFSVGCGSDNKPAAEAAPAAKTDLGPADVVRVVCDAMCSGDYDMLIANCVGEIPIEKDELEAVSAMMKRTGTTFMVGEVRIKGNVAFVKTTKTDSSGRSFNDEMLTVKKNGVWKAAPFSHEDDFVDEIDFSSFHNEN